MYYSNINREKKEMRGKKNDYSISYFHGDVRVLFLEYVHDTKKSVQWVNSKQIRWTHANVYERRTRMYLFRIYPDNIA